MKYFIAFVCMTVSISAFAQIKRTEQLTGHSRRYEKTEWNIYLTAAWQNPYFQEQVALDMLLIAPSGKTIKMPCYYESGKSGSESLWKARFAPQEQGKYQYYFQLTQDNKAVSVSKKKSFVVKPSGKDGFLHTDNNWVLRFDDNKPFRGIGEDIAWESRAHDDSKYFKQLNEDPKYNYEYMLHSLSKHGGNFFRTWICSWNLPIDWKKGFNSNRYSPSDNYYNPSALRKTDSLVDLCDSLNIYMMLTLGPGAYGTREGGVAASAADFFVNPAAITRYKNRLRYIIARWGYSTSIGAWELFNEVDNVMYANKEHPINAADIVKWHDEMSRYIKATDPYNHIVTTSISHRDLPGLNDLPAIDINQKHIYKNTKSIPSTIVEYEHKFHKPYVIGEYGYEWDWSKNFNDFAGRMDSDFKRGLWYGLFSPTPVLPMSWWWEFFDNRGTDAYIRNVRIILNQMLAAGKGAFEEERVDVSDAGVTSYSVKCGGTIFIYLYNPDSTAKRFSVSFKNSFSTLPQLKSFDCEAGKFANAEIKTEADKLVIDSVKLLPDSDKVFIISADSHLKK